MNKDARWLDNLISKLPEEPNWDCQQGHLADYSCCNPKQYNPMNLTDNQRTELKKYVFDCCMSNMFGDGMEDDYIRDGFPAFKGINHMTDDELIEEAGCQSDPEEIERFLKAIEEGRDPDDCEEDEEV